MRLKEQVRSGELTPTAALANLMQRGYEDDGLVGLATVMQTRTAGWLRRKGASVPVASNELSRGIANGMPRDKVLAVLRGCDDG